MLVWRSETEKRKMNKTRKIVRKVKIVSGKGSATFNPVHARNQNRYHMWLLTQISPITTPNEYA